MNNNKILVIEDDQNIRDVLKFALDFEGYEVTTAGNGKEGLDQLEQGLGPGLILLDLMMPVMNGWEFIDQFKVDERYSSIPVVVVSAYFEKAKNIDCTAFVAKPVELEVLLDTVKKHMLH